MTVSILHRATGSGMATVGALLLVWWLAAIAGGEKAYASFVGVFATDSGSLNPLGWVIAVGLTLALFQHMMSGLRHLVLDLGAGYELRRSNNSARLTFVLSALLTIAFWLYLGLR